MIDRGRFERALPQDKVEDTHVTCVGLGNIGSATVLRLAQMGIGKFRLVDPDKVGKENIGTQDYGVEYIGWDKVEAVADRLARINPDAQVQTYCAKIEETLLAYSDIWIVALDSIRARKLAWGRGATRCALWVDPRMALEDLEVTFLKGGRSDSKTKEYVAALDDTDHLKLPCGATSIGYTGQAAAAVIAPQVRRWLTGQPIPYMVLADLGRAAMTTIWREGEEYVAEKF